MNINTQYFIPDYDSLISDTCFMKNLQLQEICFMSTSPYVITVHEIWVDEGIMQVNHTIIMEVFSSFS